MLQTIFDIIYKVRACCLTLLRKSWRFFNVLLSRPRLPKTIIFFVLMPQWLSTAFFRLEMP